MDPNIVLETIRKEFITMKTDILNEIKKEIHFLRIQLLNKLNENCGATTGAPIQKEDPEFNCSFQEFEVLDIKGNPLEESLANFADTSGCDETYDCDDTNGFEDASGCDDTNGFEEKNDCDVAREAINDKITNNANLDDDDDDDEVVFPISTIEELARINTQIRRGFKKKYAAEIKNVIKVCGIKKCFSKIFTENVLMEMNLDGILGKIALKQYTYFIDAFYDAVQMFEPTKNEDDFLTDLRDCFRREKTKVYKRACVLSKKQRERRDNLNEGKKEMEKSINTIISLSEAQRLQANKKSGRTFPLKTFAEIENLNANINDTNRNEYIKTLKDIFKIGGLRKNFDRFLDKDLIMHYNFAGKQGKLPFNVYTNLLDLLFEALCDDKDTATRTRFYAELQNTFRAYKSRFHKKVCFERKMEKRRLALELGDSNFGIDESQEEENLKYLTEDQVPTLDGKKYKHKFPLKTPFALQMMDKMITPENRHKYVRKLKTLFKYGGMEKNFNRFMSDDLILEYNVRGISNKRPFKAHTNVIDVLFEVADLKEGSTIESFLWDLQVIFSKFKSKHYKKVCQEKKKQKESGMESDVLQIN